MEEKSLPMPYLSKLSGNITPGQSVFIKGKAHESATRFDITLHTGPNVAGANRDDIALAVSVRFDDNKFVFNSFQNGEWGKEDKDKLKFDPGEKFDIRIRATEDDFEIWCNGKKITNFKYRLPLVQIDHVYVVGECDLTKCSWEGRNYPVPFQTALPPGAMEPGKKLFIAGVVEKKADRFEVDLKAGQDFVLHFNPRFGFMDNKIVRNTCRGGAWDDVEERDGGDFPFDKGDCFELVFSCEDDLYRVFVDGKEYCTYRHRLPPQSIDNLVIEGDVDLQAVHW